MLPSAAKLVVDLGAGTGTLTKLLTDRVPTVVAVEPDERMRAVLTERVPSAQVLEGRGESIPLEDGVADAVVASSSWHWMDPGPTAAEVARVLRPGGVLGVIWPGPDWTSELFVALRPHAILERLRAAGLTDPEGPSTGDGDSADSEAAPADPEVRRRRRLELVLDPGAPMSEPEGTEIRWVLPMTPEELLGLLGTYSGVILLEPDERQALMEMARSYLYDELGLADGGTADVPYRAICWRSTRLPG